MGQQIIKQPNGKYCVWSSIVQNVIYFDCTPEEIVEIRVEEYRKEQETFVRDVCKKLEKTEKPYFQWTKTFKQMLETVKEIHGKRGLNKLRKEMKL